ncbi:molybdopterin-synthase adenylyltransferase MoeB [Verminephrobacter aporrectodeae]|uniref:Molybdopterin-synthase adenylyltransferase MoeB n=1 Tax=Verminephrobacter aporrectodeae subsp. tuberculatae TaxID=1110392 RepID=A0ABT3KY66_9BURK|nr:molybdopterin-synthase adenylyltransferase MoeB [Verminephrobacter aporrectodeae]MCW5256436.1 molybdopterin-synthase adenylyltransferase MoeB [Verminephrobacter aporrectodeae subsp. tuberculatae]MCW5323201.1 molybdopterin-synthase adenylyltransferase MoeB [Verminephrobacter aporrectodeae subsp. tuberculatae]MCW8177266.1 molybdopterin-synthase adenylyltransferase MoeB [Verminephrobacter aporrectodeae subsp. tuberculatae]MCW8200339.1 molybdopterin-synthase adenylyltransferase MoeB [Verminephro
MALKDNYLESLRRQVAEVEPHDVAALCAAGAVLIDIRDHDELADGSPLSAQAINRGFLELKIETVAPSADTRILLLCANGTRSLLAADALLRLGYRDVRSIIGGFGRWKQQGLPFATIPQLDNTERKRYVRQLLMPEVGMQGQLRLKQSRVLLIGVGGLGSPAALYLAAAGVGTLCIVDDDLVELSNLHRQIIHCEEMVARPKVDSAAQRLRSLNSSAQVSALRQRIDEHNVDAIVSDYDLVVDGSDNFSTRYLVNDACVKWSRPLVHASVFRFDGQVSVFLPRSGCLKSPCYRCLFPQPPGTDLAPSCADVGVLGVLPGIMGTIQALETIKILLDIGDPLVGRLLCVDGLSGEFQMLDVEPDPHCMCCNQSDVALQPQTRLPKVQ